MNNYNCKICKYTTSLRKNIREHIIIEHKIKRELYENYKIINEFGIEVHGHGKYQKGSSE